MPEANAQPWFKIGDAPGLRFLKEQISGMDALMPFLPRASVLDLGCAEGLIGKYYVDTLGVDVLHGVEIMKDRVEVARKQCAGYMNVNFWAADLSKPAEVDKLDGILPQYDVVLALAILHKLPDPVGVLKWAAAKARKALVVRMPGPDRIFLTRGEKRSRIDPTHILSGEFELLKAQIGPRSELTMTYKRK